MKFIRERIAAATLAAGASQRTLFLLAALAVLALAIVAFVGEERAMEYLKHRSTTLEAGIGKPLDYRDLSGQEVAVLLSLVMAASALPAFRFWEFLKASVPSGNRSRDGSP